VLLSGPRAADAYRKAKVAVDRLAGGVFLYPGARFAAGE
jgi:hypothetical protein